MNPGLLREPLSLERKSTTKDSLGQPLDTWTKVTGSDKIRARKMKPKAPEEEVSGDREREEETAVFRVRSQPWRSLYQNGDRAVEPASRFRGAVKWEIRGVSEVEGTQGGYLDVKFQRIE